MNVLVRSAGFLTSVQDLGRIGHRQSGVSLGGALDAHALRVANALVGNDDVRAGLEITLGTVRLQFQDDRTIAWCGAAFSARIGEAELSAGRPRVVMKDDELTMTAPGQGGRAWLAIAGGINVPSVLGSRSTDLRGNFGGHEGRALRDADVIPLGAAPPVANRHSSAGWGAPATWARPGSDDVVLRVVRGIDWSRFAGDAQRSLMTSAYTVAGDSDRMGLRLDGLALSRMEPGDLLSEAVTPGTIQVPPNGQPIVLLGDCQTIGGYPKIAHVITVDLPIAAQLWPGRTVRFEVVRLAQAQRLLREREEAFARFRIGLSLQTR